MKQTVYTVDCSLWILDTKVTGEPKKIPEFCFVGMIRNSLVSQRLFIYFFIKLISSHNCTVYFARFLSKRYQPRIILIVVISEFNPF